MLRAFVARTVEMRQAIWRQAKCLGDKPGELVAQTHDRVEIPQVRRLEPWHVLLFRPLESRKDRPTDKRHDGAKANHHHHPFTTPSPHHHPQSKSKS
jgi:hypothetical protein